MVGDHVDKCSILNPDRSRPATLLVRETAENQRRLAEYPYSFLRDMFAHAKELLATITEYQGTKFELRHEEDRFAERRALQKARKEAKKEANEAKKAEEEGREARTCRIDTSLNARTHRRIQPKRKSRYGMADRDWLYLPLPQAPRIAPDIPAEVFTEYVRKQRQAAKVRANRQEDNTMTGEENDTIVVQDRVMKGMAIDPINVDEPNQEIIEGEEPGATASMAVDQGPK